jgi:hypothetical protein
MISKLPKMANKHLLNGVIKSEPKGWSDEEIKKLLELKKLGFSFEQIGNIFERTAYSCNRKYYKLKKKLDTYNDKHRELKYEYNKQFLQNVDAESLLDAFSGGISWWKQNEELKVIDNDINIEGSDYKLDAFDFLYQHRKKKFDIVDLDPFGSAFDCFDFALQIAQKGLIITFGEIVGRRFNRQDFVEHRYGMNYIEDFTTQKLSDYVVKRALIYRKILTPIIKAEMTNISRVYYKIEHFDYGNSGCKYFPKKEIVNLFS